MILVLVNECVAVLREGVASDADLIDAAVIFGTGFAPFRGGPLAYARSRGVAEVVARLDELAERYGSRFRARMPGWKPAASRAAEKREPVPEQRNSLCYHRFGPRRLSRRVISSR